MATTPTKAKTRSNRPRVARPWAWRWKGGYIIAWDSLKDTLKGADILEFKGRTIGAQPLKKIVECMEKGYHAFLTPIEVNGEEPGAPFHGPGIQIEVGPDIERTPEGNKVRWRKTDRKPFYSRFRFSDGAYIPKINGKKALCIVKLEPKLLHKSHKKKAEAKREV